MKEIEILQKKLEFITAMKDGLIETDAEMNEVKYFSSEFLVKRYLGMSEDDLRENKIMKDKEIQQNLKNFKR